MSINLDLTKQFTELLKQANIPTTEQEFQAQWDALLIENGFEINNQSPFSPFWRLQKALIAKPAKEMVDILTTQIMPNTFVLSAQNEWLDAKGAGRNTPRLQAVKTQGNVQIHRVDSSGELTIQKGTLIQSTPINGVVYQVQTLFDVTLADGVASINALVEATEFGSDHNLPGGYYNNFVIPIEGVSVTNNDDWLVKAGQLVESDSNYQLRIRDKFATSGNFHVDAVYRSIISEFPGILADNIIFDHTAPRGPGSANAYVYLPVGTVTQTVVDSINNHTASGYHGHGDDLLVFAIPTTPKNIELQYWLKPNETDIKTQIEQFIRAAFRENSAYEATTCKPNENFSFSLLASELHAQFPQISSLNFITNDFNTGMSLPVIDTLTVTKQG
ncbi:baseplate J/gp47 family protein [Thalassotalea sp. 1_MG-2023]|uniref:baseplate J/gp47 family protein n=1 Tax=Thalassotalea sp. 1_MG-2023 TaxID=3062680 RepID=UPI0026E1BC23|nr:baseplate J/gp47 family protein [Thalassotalea sp. 1_MG-2023]MDO6426241.1 baseplate J/gp47 family protein [Thalassotalea sp. 1_MG-2023]